MPNPKFLTPSTFHDLMSNGKSKGTIGKSAYHIVDRLILDLLEVERPEEMTPISCQWGIDHEWEAIQEYQERTFNDVRQPQFTISKTHPYVGGTMDGLVGDKGGIEVKSPFNSIEHFYNMTECRQANTIYKYQIQGYFWIYDLEWIDFVSYDPRFPNDEKLAIHRIQRDEDIISQLKNRCEWAYNEAISKVQKIVDAS